MTQKQETTTLVAFLLITAAMLGVGYWWFNRQPNSDLGQHQQVNNTPTSEIPPATVAPGTTITIDGSTAMVQINQALKRAFEQQYPQTTVITNAKGSDKGIKSLLARDINIAALSRSLSDEEKSQGLVAIPVARDYIAIVVGINNPLRTGLTKTQVQDIFTGLITDWSSLGRESATIKVINRPAVSGTHQVFKELVLEGKNFGTTPNIIKMTQDATTPILQKLGTDGISYATYSQVVNQQTVRVVPIDGLTPEAADYPYQRILYYVYKEPATPEVQAFLDYVTSEKGRQAIFSNN